MDEFTKMDSVRSQIISTEHTELITHLLEDDMELFLEAS